MTSHKLETQKPKHKQPWFIRRVIYAFVAVVALVANYFFDIPVTQTNAWYPMVETIVDFVAPVLLIFAATKANAGADANLTESDLTETQLNVIEARERVETAKETESKLDDIASRVNLAMVSVTNLVDEIRPILNKPPQVTEEVRYEEPSELAPPVELSLESLRDRMSDSV